MADTEAQSAPAPAEDDETWLYGEEGKENSGTKEVNGVSAPEVSTEEKKTPEKKEDREEGEMSGEEESQEKEDSDESDDDDVQVTIGDIQTFPLNEGPRNLFKTQGGYQKPVTTSSTSKTTTSTSQKGVDVDAVGTINGVPTYEFDLDGIQADEKGWRKPGADITDYFNYGFNEDTWRQYCDKQRKMRIESQTPVSRIYVHQSGTAPHAQTSVNRSDSKRDSLHPPGTDVPQTVPVIGSRKTGGPPNRKMSGTIDVIGSTARDSRRPDAPAGDPIPVAGGRKQYTTPGIPPGLTSVPPPGLPTDYSVPPPGLPPPGFPPPPGVPPPGLTTVPPPGYPPDYDPYYPPPGQAPSSRYDDRTPYSFNSSVYSSSYMDSVPWDRENRTDNYNRWDYGRGTSPRSESEFSSSGSEKDYRYSRDKSRYSGRDRDSYRRDRDRDRDWDRERSSSYARDRERSRSRDRDHRRGGDDKHRSRRKDDSDSHRSKHKKSKRSKREKDDNYDPSNPSREDSSVKAD